MKIQDIQNVITEHGLELPDYQLELVSQLVHCDSALYLPNGCGKRFLVGLVCAAIRKSERRDKSKNFDSDENENGGIGGNEGGRGNEGKGRRILLVVSSKSNDASGVSGALSKETKEDVLGKWEDYMASKFGLKATVISTHQDFTSQLTNHSNHSNHSNADVLIINTDLINQFSLDFSDYSCVVLTDADCLYELPATVLNQRYKFINVKVLCGGSGEIDLFVGYKVFRSTDKSTDENGESAD